MLRAHLEYASDVWDPHLLKDKTLIENVQKFGLRICAKQWDLGYFCLTLQSLRFNPADWNISSAPCSKLYITSLFFLLPFLYHARVEMALMPTFNLLRTQTLSCILLFLALFHCGIHYLVMSLVHLHSLKTCVHALNLFS